MAYKPVVGGTRWVNEGIEPTKAYWVESFALWKAIKDQVLSKEPLDREELTELVHRLGASMLGMRAGLYELEVITAENKPKRTKHGETTQSQEE